MNGPCPLRGEREGEKRSSLAHPGKRTTCGFDPGMHTDRVGQSLAEKRKWKLHYALIKQSKLPDYVHEWNDKLPRILCKFVKDKHNRSIR